MKGFVPNDQQLAALRAFAYRHAKKRGGWKEHLIECWLKGHDAGEPNGHLLRQVRNDGGPDWLRNYPIGEPK